ncbi:PREDICTED: translocating chain-associated membrane protein 1-like [Priapulus caudatus]|uniref:Translocating chain-associated membrane protein 1-like n=1 Tax=Priapulus caudatus TaxID=37621 RepID=A0ABM1EIP0_PRICU|nr:PREDICTED: translocating chain-associated membrane protein 1-like [Priapulus caudatus]
MGIRRRPGQKSPPILSHEFIIQNHADIVSCVAMVFIVGLMCQFSAPFASLFVAMQHNHVPPTEEELQEEPAAEFPQLYTYGVKDLCAIFFYFLICIVMHAVIQEYVLDRLNRRMHLSKVKHSKFNESGQLLAFYTVSVIWGIDIILREKYAHYIGVLWEGYPHNLMPFVIKFFFIVQLAYWLHVFPELYFQKTKREEMAAKVQYGLLYLLFIGTAYILNFTRVALCLTVLHYLVEGIFHFSRLMYFSDKNDVANVGFMIWDVLFVLVRLGTITLSVLTFW